MPWISALVSKLSWRWGGLSGSGGGGNSPSASNPSCSSGLPCFFSLIFLILNSKNPSTGCSSWVSSFGGGHLHLPILTVLALVYGSMGLIKVPSGAWIRPSWRGVLGVLNDLCLPPSAIICWDLLSRTSPAEIFLAPSAAIKSICSVCCCICICWYWAMGIMEGMEGVPMMVDMELLAVLVVLVNPAVVGVCCRSCARAWFCIISCCWICMFCATAFWRKACW